MKHIVFYVYYFYYSFKKICHVTIQMELKTISYKGSKCQKMNSERIEKNCFLFEINDFFYPKCFYSNL